MKKPTHKQRVLKLLKEAGETGVHSFELARKISFRAAARINDLKRDGHEITSRQEKRGDSYGVRYFLKG